MPVCQNVIVVILNWNGWTDTLTALESVRVSAPAIRAVLVVDNGSTDGSVERMLDALGPAPRPEMRGSIPVYRLRDDPPVELAVAGENSGGAGGRNLGISLALQRWSGDYVYFLDNDAVVDAGTISHAVEAAGRTGAGIVGSLVRRRDGSVEFGGLNFRKNIFYLDRLFGRTDGMDLLRDRDVDEVSSCGMLVSRPLLEILLQARGMAFDSGLFHWSEDQEICLMAKRLGFRVILSPRSEVIHKLSRGRAGLRAACYYSSRNRMILANRFLPPGLRLLFHLFYPPYRVARAVHELARGQTGVAKAHIQGLLDGYIGVRGAWMKSQLSRKAQ